MLHQSPVNDVDMVSQARHEQNVAIAAGNIEAASLFWTEDVTLRGGLGSCISGRDAYRALFDSPRNENSLIYVREPDLIEISRDWPLAFESGTWVAKRGSLEGPIAITGRYAAQWVKCDGHWLIRSEVFVALQDFRR